MKTIEKIELIRKQNMLEMHMNYNFHGAPFRAISQDIIREFTKYWNLEISLDRLFENLDNMGIDEYDINHLIDNCFLNDNDFGY